MGMKNEITWKWLKAQSGNVTFTCRYFGIPTKSYLSLQNRHGTDLYPD